MLRKIGLTLGAMSLVMTALPAHAATAVPAVVQIEDPLNDANFLNDQDSAGGTPAAGQGDHTLPACPPSPAPCDGATVSDLLKVWYSNTKDTVSIHILTERPPPAISTIYYRVAASPGEGPVAADTRGCLNWRFIFGGKSPAVNGQTHDVSTYRDEDPTKGTDYFEFEDTCNGDGEIEIAKDQVTVETLEDTTGIVTMTVPRSASPLFGKGAKIASPYAISRLVAGKKGETLPYFGGSFFSAGTGDTTKRGTDFALIDKKKKVKKPKPKPKQRPPRN